MNFCQENRMAFFLLFSVAVYNGNSAIMTGNLCVMDVM
jgi:hypothetical protein